MSVDRPSPTRLSRLIIPRTDRLVLPSFAPGSSVHSPSTSGQVIAKRSQKFNIPSFEARAILLSGSVIAPTKDDVISENPTTIHLVP
jgi:hypothetical protein